MTEEEIKEARRAYSKKWRDEHRDHVNEYAKQWRQSNPDKVEQINARFWQKKAAERREAAERGKRTS